MTEETSPAPPAGPIASAPSEASMYRLKRAALIAEIIGATAVVISLIFVGVQLMQANTLAREAAEQKQIQDVAAVSRLTVENPQLADVMAKGTTGAELSPEEMVLITAFNTFAERTWEGLYEQYRNGQVDPALWEAHRRMARAMEADPLNQQVWAQRKNWYSDRYRAFRDADGAGDPENRPTYSLKPVPVPVRPPTVDAPEQ
jgi:hypothetical protein